MSVAESDALHARVRAFAESALAGMAPVESFDELAVAIARFQESAIPGFRRLVDKRRATLVDAATIPAVPVDAFRLTRIAAHAAELDAVRFLTSGTTGSARGTHAMRSTATYRALSLAWGARALLAGPTRPVVVALAEAPGETATSSLGFMMREFMREFDGRALARGAAFDANDPARWLLGPSGVDVEGLRRAVREACTRGISVLLLATSFALVALLDALGDGIVEFPPGSVIMTTGGFKGRSREVAPDELTRAVSRALRVPEPFLVGEYGMTELTSQLYEGTLPGAGLQGPRGTFLPPPWLRVVPVDPDTLSPVADGEAGIARFVDLGNVDSAVALVTQDVVRRSGDGIGLLGRRPGAPARGCSLSVEDMIVGARRS